MPNVRNTILKKYNISSYRFMELYYHCLQYNDACDVAKRQMIEQTARDAGGDIADYILKAVTTEGATYEYLAERGLPCGKHMYYDRRKKFYLLLSDRLK